MFKDRSLSLKQITLRQITDLWSYTVDKWAYQSNTFYTNTNISNI